MALEVNVLRREEDGLFIIALKGSLDSNTAQDLKTKAQKYINLSPQALLLDLEHLEYISSIGISVLLELIRAMENKNGTLMMANIPAHIEHVFKIVNALPSFQMFKDIEEADRYFLEIQKRIKEQR